MILSGTTKSTIETRMSILKNAGKIFTNFMKAILTALNVFSLLAIKEINSANPVMTYRTYKLYPFKFACNSWISDVCWMHLFCNDLQQSRLAPYPVNQLAAFAAASFTQAVAADTVTKAAVQFLIAGWTIVVLLPCRKYCSHRQNVILLQD